LQRWMHVDVKNT
jgi:hypothetical protein